MLRIFLRVFSLSNVQNVLLVGSIPGDLEHLGQGVQRLQRSRRLDAVASLEALLEDDRPTVAATVVAQGLPSGILISEGSDQVLSDSWWSLPDEYELFLFCFSCFSADYLSIADLWRMIQGAIGFEGPLWISVSDGGRHLVPFLEKVRYILGKYGRDLDQTFADIMQEYARALRRRLGRKDEPGENYLRKLCMLRQMRQMRLLPMRGRL